MTQPAGQKPIDTQHAKIQEPVQEKGSAFGRVMGFITAPIANAWHHMFTSEPVKEKQPPERVITKFDEDHVLESGPVEGLTIGQSKKIYDIMQNSLLTPQQKEQEKAKILGKAAEPKDDYETEEDTASSSSEMSSLVEENAELRREIEALRRLQSSPREEQLVALLRELLASGAQAVTRTPYSYSSEHLAVSFVEEQVLPLLGEKGDWFIRETVEKDGKKIATSRLTDAGRAAVQTLEKLGIITQDATAQGGVLYRPQPKWNNEKAVDYIRRAFTNWAEGQKEMVLDAEKAEGYCDFSNPDAYRLLDKYVNSPSAQDSKKAADSLGFPPRDELFRVAVALARAHALEVVEQRASELFENAKDKQCMKELQGDFKEYPKLKSQVGAMERKRDEGIRGLEAHFEELDAKAEEIRAKQALIQSVLSGESTPAASSVPPPPPPPPGF